MIANGRPASSSAYIFLTCLAISFFQGGGLVVSCFTWSVMSGVHVPDQSGSVASALYSFNVGAASMGSLSAARTDAAPSPATTTAVAQAANTATRPEFNSNLFIGSEITASRLAVTSLKRRECRRYGLRRDGLARDIGEGFGVELEAREVRGENQSPPGAQQLQRPANHAGVIALDVEAPLHAFGVGEGRRVDEDEVETRPPDRLALQPFEAIGAEQLVLGSAEAVEQQVLVRPIQIRIG